jgi:hypothetical protein
MDHRKEQRVCSSASKQFLAKHQMALIPHPADLAPCDFFLFPKMKLKLKARRFDAIEEIQAESQTVLDRLTIKDFQEAFQNGEYGGTDVYKREGTTSRLMAADRPYGEFYDLYSASPEYFGQHHVRSLLKATRRFILFVMTSRAGVLIMFVSK